MVLSEGCSRLLLTVGAISPELWFARLPPVFNAQCQFVAAKRESEGGGEGRRKNLRREKRKTEQKALRIALPVIRPRDCMLNRYIT